MAKKSTLTDAEKAANVAAGLTPTGRVKIKHGTKEVDKAPVYKDGDYRCTGHNFTPHRKNHYLRVIRESGDRVLARAEVGVSKNTVSIHRSKDHQFRDAEDEALRQHAAIYSQEMKRRGVVGVQRPVFGNIGPGQGSGVVGFVTEYSDRLLLEQAKRFNSDYTPKQKIEQTVTTTSTSLGLESLSPESQEDLLRILEREKALRGDLDPE